MRLAMLSSTLSGMAFKRGSFLTNRKDLAPGANFITNCKHMRESDQDNHNDKISKAACNCGRQGRAWCAGEHVSSHPKTKQSSVCLYGSGSPSDSILVGRPHWDLAINALGFAKRASSFYLLRCSLHLWDQRIGQSPWWLYETSGVLYMHLGSCLRMCGLSSTGFDCQR